MNPFAVLALMAIPEMEAIKMSGSSLTRTALLFASLSLAGGAALAAPASPFLAMAGTWAGGGVLSTTDGQQEQLRCRASYDVGGAGDQLRLNLTCASASYKFDLASEVEYRGGAIRGHGPKQAATLPVPFPDVRPAITSRRQHEATASRPTCR
jgi:hypothetical protein